ncbi:Non-specific serine/threonine protein kinase [Bertholletia excelsa]
MVVSDDSDPLIMIKPAQLIILFAVCIVPTIATATQCSQSCSKAGGPALSPLPFPFGFSSGCPIQLNCTPNGTAVIDYFPIQQINPDSIILGVPADCGRPFQILQRLFSRNYALSTGNGILLRNCTSNFTRCVIPKTEVQTNFELLDCGSKKEKNNTIDCYFDRHKETEFMNYTFLMGLRCWSFFSAISVNSLGNSSEVSLGVQVVKLGWWLEGECQCSENANCTEVSSPIDGAKGYRCRCLDGFNGDGYRNGSGCQRASSTCNPARFISGRCGGRTRIVVLVGVLVVGAVLTVSVGLICCLVRRRSRTKYNNAEIRQLTEAKGITIAIYHAKEIERATNYFSPKQHLGTGAYGMVYAGKLNDDWVAIKRIKNRGIDSTDQVVNEIKLLSSVSHPNLVRLLGCSLENGEQILVYEFMPNGTLSQHLQRERSDGLAWPVRLKIATETAQAIAYLHSAMDPPIYHRDIKSSNILLDYDFKSKVADFGLSRLGMTEWSHISTAPQGTPGYLDPQYHQNYHLSDKSDVYSFGVVLVEIITAMKAVDFARLQNEVNLAALAVDRIEKGRLEEIIDPLIEPESDAWTLSSVHRVAELAFRCLAYERDTRPSMTEVVAELEQIGRSRWAESEENVESHIGSASSSFCSTSNLREEPLGVITKKLELGNGSVNSMERMKDPSPVSVQEPWLSEENSPSSSTLLTLEVQ